MSYSEEQLEFMKKYGFDEDTDFFEVHVDPYQDEEGWRMILDLRMTQSAQDSEIELEIEEWREQRKEKKNKFHQENEEIIENLNLKHN